MQQLLPQFGLGVFYRRPLSCVGFLRLARQYPISCTSARFPYSPPVSDTVAKGTSTTAQLRGTGHPSVLRFCPNLSSSLSLKYVGRCSITELSAAKVSALPISADLQEGLQRLGIRRLAEVQRVCLLRALGGASLVVAANPGAGKTLAYLLPVLQRFVAEDGRHTSDVSAGSHSSPFALILVPSRELARQVANAAVALLPQAPVLLLDPASPVRHHQRLLSHLHVKIVVSTPDRIRSLVRERPQAAGAGRTEQAELAHLSLKNLQILVVDEADCMLRRDYHSKVQFIYREATGWKASEGGTGPGERFRDCRSALQVLCFSAVLPSRLLDTFEADFPHAEVLNLLNAAKCGTQGGIYEGRQALAELSAEVPSNRSGSPGSAVVGAGVSHHICYMPACNTSHSPPNTICDESAVQQNIGGRRRGQTAEEEHVERERKMLALAEILRAFIPRLIQGNCHSANPGILGTGGTEDAGKFPECREALANASASSPKEQPIDAGGEEQTSASGLQPPVLRKLSTEAERSTEEGHPQCIVFADSQEEVRYIKNHPLLDSWRIASVHSRMDAEDRERAIQSFLEGDASVLVSTDIAARGFDIPSVVLVVHFHPPSTPENYTHRTGRAGRGRTPGASVVLCSTVEVNKLRDVERLGHVYFERRTLPAAADCQELMLKQLIADMLNVPYAQYASLLHVAQRLQEKVGEQALATVLLKLGGASANSALGLARSERRSVLSGRQGFVPLLLYDPTHARLQGSMAARRLLQHLLPRGATPEAVGRIVKSVNGFVADVSVTYAEHIMQAGKCRETNSNESLSRDCSTSAKNNCFQESWVPIFHLDQLPRLLSGGIGRRRHLQRLPWTRMKLSLAGSRKESHRQAAQKHRVLKRDSLQLQMLKNIDVGKS